jgi:hypothetical protein
MNIPKHVIDKQMHAKIKFFNVKWTLKNKNLQQSHHLKLYVYIYRESFNALH